MLWRYLGKPESDGDLSGFIDGHEISEWARSAKAWALDTGLIHGMGDGILDSGGNASRAQFAQMLMNLLGM